LKLLSVDKLFSTKDLLAIHYAPNFAPAETENHVSSQYTATLELPPFPSGSAETDERLQCAVRLLGSELTTEDGLTATQIIGRADRQELSPGARRRYASNWALAQQRAVRIEVLLGPALRANVQVALGTAGPVFTSSPVRDASWDRDRAVTIILRGSGKLSDSLRQQIADINWSKCSHASS
jgi:hypothetical protein